ncbi:MAG TPA: hypothetical protein VI485_05905 [Vicinamibacterales bacterium]|nr:hypothetical protein [Vicinamibacterales bacterium]
MTPRHAIAIAITVVAVLFCPVSSRAAGSPAADVALEIKRLAATIKEIRANPSLDQDDRLANEIAFHSRRQRFFLVYAILRDRWGIVVTPADIAAASPPDSSAVEQARTDVQAGASASSSGSSSLISKGSGPSYFAAAVENGALLKSASATTTTFQGNLIGIFDALNAKGYAEDYEDAKVTRFLRRLSFSFTLRNTNPEAAPEPTDTAPDAAGLTDTIRRQVEQFDQRLEQYSARAIVGRNRRDPRDEANLTALQKLMSTRGQQLLEALDEALADLSSDEYDAWITDSVRELKAVPLPFLEGTIVKRLNLLCDIANEKVPAFQDHAVSAYQAYSAFLSARSTILDAIEKRPLLSVEYVHQRQTLEAGWSTYRFIGEGQKGRWDLTANAAYTRYHHRPESGGSLFRDFQIGAAADRPLGNPALRGQSTGPFANAVLSIAFLYERLSESATVVFGDRTLSVPPGNLYLGQLRVTLPMGAAGVKMPVSVTFSNRTELIEEKQVRANAGFTFNFDAVAAAIRP